MWQQIASNRRKSIFLAAVMAAILIAAGAAIGVVYIGGQEGPVAGAFLALVVWLILLAVSYYSGDKIFLTMSGAHKIGHNDFPELYNVVEEMKIASGMPKMPDIYIIDDPTPNAFATGRSPESASVAVTSGLLTRLNRDELQGVIAHEMSHVVNRDVMFMMFVGVMLGAIVLLGDMMWRVRLFGGGGRRRSSSSGGGQAQLILFLIALVFIILSPIIAQLVYLALSRKREYLADSCGAQLTRYPEGLASALEKISAAPGELRAANRITAPMYIVNPFSKARRAAAGLFSTHPPAEERIRILRGIGGGAYSLEAYQEQYGKTSGGRRLFSAGDLKNNLFTKAGARFAAPAAAVSFAATPRSQSQPIASRSEVSDVFWKKEGYGLIDCACGVRLKIPREFHSKTVICPKCGTKHQVPG
jgi:heat shock protein HtpX